MIVAPSPRIAGHAPATDLAVLVGFRIRGDPGAFRERSLEPSPRVTVIGRERGRPVTLRLEAGSRDHDVHSLGIHALRNADEVRVERELEDRSAARLACELRIDRLIAPVAERTGRRDPQQQVGATAPAIVQQRRLRNGLRAASHRVEGAICERPRDSRAFDLDDLVPLAGQVLEVAPLVERAALDEDVEQRIVKMRTLDTAVQRLDVQVREVPALEVPDEVGRAQVDDFPVLDHAGADLVKNGGHRPPRIFGNARWYA